MYVLKVVRGGAFGTAAEWFQNGDHPGDDCHMVKSEFIALPMFLSEGKVVRRFRSPWVEGTDHCRDCGNLYRLHGWLDQGPVGQKVCPGDWVVTDKDGIRLAYHPDRFKKEFVPYEEVSCPRVSGFCPSCRQPLQADQESILGFKSCCHIYKAIGFGELPNDNDLKTLREAVEKSSVGSPFDIFHPPTTPRKAESAPIIIHTAIPARPEIHIGVICDVCHKILGRNEVAMQTHGNGIKGDCVHIVNLGYEEDTDTRLLEARAKIVLDRVMKVVDEQLKGDDLKYDPDTRVKMALQQLRFERDRNKATMERLEKEATLGILVREHDKDTFQKVMWWIDQWLSGPELENDPVQRACLARQAALAQIKQAQLELEREYNVEARVSARLARLTKALELAWPDLSSGIQRSILCDILQDGDVSRDFGIPK